MSKLLSYFEKDVDVYVDYVHEDEKKIPDTFNIYVIQKNKAQMLTNLMWSEIDTIADFLEKEDKAVELWRPYGIGKEVITVPKWATTKLSKKLRETKRLEEKRMREEDEIKMMSFSELISTKDEKAMIIGQPLLISGIGGSGKTVATQKLIPELLKQGQRVAIIDFRNEYGEMTEKHNGLSLTGEELHDIDNQLVRIHFGDDVFYHFDEKYYLPLMKLAEHFDYLVLDDAIALYHDCFEFDFPNHSNIYDVCASLIKQNLHLKIILLFQSMSSLYESDATSLQGLFSHKLLFRQTRSELVSNQKELFYLEMGEAICIIDKKPKITIQFKEEMIK